MIKDILIVGLGSFVGGTLRYMLLITFNKIARSCTFPIGILVVNVLGCFLIGVLYSYFKNRVGESLLPLLLMTGVLGGFTTFSTFSLEVLQLYQQNELLKAILYVIVSVGIGILACFLGCIVGNK